MESFESPSLSGETDKPDFISLQAGGEKKPDFIPLEHSGDNYKKRKEAEDIVKKAQEKGALLEREAYEKGFAQGEKDGLELGEKRGLKVVENIENFFIEMSNLKKEILKQYEKEILELIFAIAKKIIHHQITSDEKAVEDTVLEALRLAVEKSEITLRVNPEDFDYVERLRPDFFAKFEELKSIMVTSDPSITRGGCFLETAYGDLDARVETQLEKIYQSLEGVRKIDN
jgi:flagellar assembly protein FliH